jgi:serine/threonine protein kinase
VLSKLGKYEIRRELGRGSMGVVYEGFDPFIERRVAIKTMQMSRLDKSEVPEISSRFRREARAAGRLNHPNIVSIYEYGEEGDIAYIAMEYIVGTELKEHFDRSERFRIGESANIMLQLLEALEYSHNHGVVHRDVKPSNILITQDGRIKIADFGIAKIDSSELTQVGTVLGTPSYMSPEQFMGETADRRSDLYSAGVILYQLLTGERPFTGASMAVIMHKILNQAPVPPSALNAGVSKALDEVVKKAMSKRPEDRFQTAAAFMTALKLATDIIALSERAHRPEATIKVSHPETDPAAGGEEAAVAFSMADIERRLEESRRHVSYGGREAPVQEDPDEAEDQTTVAMKPDTAAVAVKHEPQEDAAPAFGLLAELAREAQEKLGAKRSAAEDSQAKARRVHDALNAIIKFFTAFNQHVNQVEPEVGRSYSLDARTIYGHLKWQRAVIDSRKQSLSDSALLAQTTFSVNLCAPGPVVVRRPWDQFDALRKELLHVGLRPLDDLEEIRKRPKQEWLEARLAPDFPVQIRFQGNYDKGCIDVTGRNIGAFGATAFQLKPEDVTPKLLDDLGLFLLGRTGKLPAALRKI